MVPLEAQACGRPVVAYGAGGSLETVRGNLEPGRPQAARTGVYFPEQSADSVVDGILAFEAAEAAGEFNSAAIREWASGFRTEVFLSRVRAFILSVAPQAAASMSSASPLA